MRLQGQLHDANRERLDMQRMVETFKQAVSQAKLHVQGAQVGGV